MVLSQIRNFFGFQDFLVNFQVKHRSTALVIEEGQLYQAAPSRQTAIWLVKSRLEKDYEGKHVDVVVY